MQFFTEIKNLFYPNICQSCSLVLTTNENTICTSCLFELPLTDYLKNKNNAIEKKFYGRIKIENATSLLFYHNKGIVKELIHNLKYKGQEKIGSFLGNWLGKEMGKYNFAKDIDYIIPVPLHKKRLQKRGYNQVTKFGERLAYHLNKPLKENLLFRKLTNFTQTKKSRLDRWKNVKEIFSVSDISLLENKHILLIDDIITTGATLESCANVLLKARNVRISIVVMAVTE